MTLLPIVFAGAGIVLAATGIWLRRRPVREEVFHVFRCQACGQKIRYQAHKAGRKAVCPRCKQCFLLPTTPQLAPSDLGAAVAPPVRVGQLLRRSARRSQEPAR
jgi:DNA-directed RNA polymerase subunit RPC12/RpoP